MTINILRGGISQAVVDIDEQTVYSSKLLGERKISATFIHRTALLVQIGDYIEFRGERYTINTVPNVEKINNSTYRYTITFEGDIYRMYDKIFMDEGSASFTYFGSAQDFLNLLLTNINSIDAGWTSGTVDSTTEKHISFEGESCRTALTRIAEAFGLEYKVTGKAITLTRVVGVATNLDFQYGRGLGLYSLTRGYVSDKNIVTRLYASGSSRNLPDTYRNGSKRLSFSGNPLEANTEFYGIKEGSVTFEDVYPQRTGTLSAVSGTDIFQVTDSGLDFNINSQLLEGQIAKIVFKTGALTGYEFEINRYDAATKTIHFNEVVEANDYKLPNSLNKPAVGDTYTLVDIAMPQSYITAAESELQLKAQTYLIENSRPRVIYGITIDEKYIRDNGVELHAGDRVNLRDTDLGINQVIRCAEVSFPLVNPAQITATISDLIPYTIQERVIAETIDNQKEIKVVDRTNAEKARRNSLRMRELQGLVFDPDGYFNPERIKPFSIETYMLSVGAKSQNFNLDGVVINPNTGGNPNHFTASAGQLIHREIEIEGLGYTWAMSAKSSNNLVSETAYYVYARCSRTALFGTWELSDTPILVDAEAGFYNFNLGILYAVKDGYRDFAFTNGMTYIVGDTITTGKVKDITGQNYFDLTAGSFNMGTASEGIDWNVTADGQLTIRGAFVTKMVFAEDAEIVNLLVSSLKTSTTGQRIEILEATNDIKIYNAAGDVIAEISGSSGSDGLGNSLGGVVCRNPTTLYVSHLTSQGVFSNGSGLAFKGAAENPNTSASVVGILNQVIPGSSPGLGYLSAAVAGVDNSGGYPGAGNYAYAGYFEGNVRIADKLHTMGHQPFTGDINMKLEIDNPPIDFEDMNGEIFTLIPSDGAAAFYKFRFLNGTLWRIEPGAPI